MHLPNEHGDTHWLGWRDVIFTGELAYLMGGWWFQWMVLLKTGEPGGKLTCLSNTHQIECGHLPCSLKAFMSCVSLLTSSKIAISCESTYLYKPNRPLHLTIIGSN